MFERFLIFLLKRYKSKLPRDNFRFYNDIDDKIYFSMHELIKFLKEKLEG